MFSFLSSVRSYLPLAIKGVTWDGDSLILYGHEWSFTTSSAWRVMRNNKLLFACWDDEVAAYLESLIGASVVEVAWLLNEQPFDPSLVLSDNKKLDVFSSSSYEPWVLKLPGITYVGDFGGF